MIHLGGWCLQVFRPRSYLISSTVLSNHQSGCVTSAQCQPSASPVPARCQHSRAYQFSQLGLRPAQGRRSREEERWSGVCFGEVRQLGYSHTGDTGTWLTLMLANITGLKDATWQCEQSAARRVCGLIVDTRYWMLNKYLIQARDKIKPRYWRQKKCSQDESIDN